LFFKGKNSVITEFLPLKVKIFFSKLAKKFFRRFKATEKIKMKEETYEN